MPIVSRFYLDKNKRKYVATKKFTDREEPKESFDKHIDNIIDRRATQDEVYDVLVYYGVGGIGKTTLLRELKNELDKKKFNSIYLSVDFKEQVNHAPARALLEMTKNYKSEKNISFPHFDIAYSLLFRKRNPDYSYNEKQLPYQSEASIIADILGTIDGFGIVSGCKGIVSKLYKVYNKMGLDKNLKKDLRCLEELSASEIEERLPAYFAYDLKKSIEKHNIKVSCIFIDTYEELWKNIDNNIKKNLVDEWVRDLIANLPNVLFVICGREKLQWSKQDDEWNEVLDQHLLGSLDKQNANEFLINCGVSESNIREKIIQASEGHPYHLDLSVDTYFELRNKDVIIKPEDFGSNKREILERFIKNLNKFEIETLKLMVVPRFYNNHIFRYLINKINTGYPITSFNEFNYYSFLTSEDRINYSIHSLMREGLIEYMSYDLIQEIHQLLAEYYDERLSNFDHSITYDDKKIFLGENIYHKLNSLEDREFIRWLKDNRINELKYFQINGEASFLKEIFTNIYNKIHISHIDIELYNILVDIIHLSGEYKKAVKLSEQYLSQFCLEDIVDNKHLLFLKIRSIHHRMFYEPVNKLIEELIQLQSRVDKDKFLREYNELIFMIGGNLGVLSGNFTEAKLWLMKSIDFSNKFKFYDYKCRALRKKIDILRANNDYDYAEKLCKEAIDICKTNDYKRYSLYLICTLGDIYRAKGLYNDGLMTLNQAEKMVKSMGIKGWEGHVNLALANINIEINEVQIAKNYLRKSKKIYKQLDHKWGLINTSIAELRCSRLEYDTNYIEKSKLLLNRVKLYNYSYEAGMIKELNNERKINHNLLFL